MKIEYISKKNLEYWARNSMFRFENDIALSLSRAISQSENPFAADDEILLIVAAEGSKLLAYIGLLPSVAGREGYPRITWNSCWWVSQETSAATGIALLKEFFRLAGNHAAFSDLNQRSSEVLQLMGMKLKKREGVVLRLRPGFHLRAFKRSMKGRYVIPAKILRKSGLLHVLDVVLKPFYHIPKPEMLSRNGEIIRINSCIPPEEVFSFIYDRAEKDIGFPSRERLEWMGSYPWISTRTGEKEVRAKDYYFSTMASVFSWFWLLLYQDDKLTGAGFFNQRDGMVKSLYIYVDENSAEIFYREVTGVLKKDVEIHSMVSFHPGFSEFLKTIPVREKRKKLIQRFYGTADPELQDLNFNDGDGDYSFT